MKKIILVLFVFILKTTYAINPPTIVATGNQYYYPGTSLSIVEAVSIMFDSTDLEIYSVYIQISSGYTKGQDQLTLNNASLHPYITAIPFDPNTGILKLTSSTGNKVSSTDFEAAIKDVQFSSSSIFPSGNKTFSISIATRILSYLPRNKHFYEYVPALGISWTDAKIAAETKNYYGLKGYLATLTAADEAQLTGGQSSGAGWIGGSDAQTEGVWKWVTGPEGLANGGSGIVFWNGVANGSSPNFAFWNTNEPNQYNGANEDYTLINSPGVGISGSWNDMTNTGEPTGNYQPKGYIVEYGGMIGDVDAIQISASTSIIFITGNQAPTINPIRDISINQNTPKQTVNLSGISDGELVTSQIVTVTATSNNTALIPNPTVNYSSNSSTGTLQFTPLLNGSGSATITLTAKDDGGILNGGTDTIIKTFKININSSPIDILLSGTSVPKKLINQVIGNLSAMDIDIADFHTYQLVSGIGDTNNGSFLININNQLINTVAFNLEEQSTYSVRIRCTDNANNSIEKNFNITVINFNDITLNPVIQNTYCDGANATGTINITVAQTNGTVSYSWIGPNGFNSTQENLTNLSQGTYTVTVTDSNYSKSQDIVIGTTPIYSGLELCYVTSDETYVSKNRIYINNQGNYNVAFYEILRESNVSNYYTSIGTILPTEISFLDVNSDNTAKSYRYKVRLVDNCGNPSPNSTFQKTILLQSTVAINNSVSLSWTHYEGITYGTYNIYRKTNIGIFELIGSIASTDNAYNDQTANVLTNKYEYYVAIDVSSCATSAAGKIKATSEIKSNLQKLGNSLSINANVLASEIILYPNPVSTKVVLEIPESIQFSELEIYNTLGQKIKSIKEKEFLVEFLPIGTYLIKIFTNQGTVVKNFIKK